MTNLSIFRHPWPSFGYGRYGWLAFQTLPVFPRSRFDVSTEEARD